MMPKYKTQPNTFSFEQHYEYLCANCTSEMGNSISWCNEKLFRIIVYCRVLLLTFVEKCKTYIIRTYTIFQSSQ